MGILITTIATIMALTSSYYFLSKDLLGTDYSKRSVFAKTRDILSNIFVSVLIASMTFWIFVHVFLVFDEPVQAQETLISTQELDRIIYDDKNDKYVCFDSNGEHAAEFDGMRRRQIKLVETEEDTRTIIVETWTGQSKLMGIEETSYTIYMPKDKDIEYSIEEVYHE